MHSENLAGKSNEENCGDFMRESNSPNDEPLEDHAIPSEAQDILNAAYTDESFYNGSSDTEEPSSDNLFANPDDDFQETSPLETHQSENLNAAYDLESSSQGSNSTDELSNEYALGNSPVQNELSSDQSVVSSSESFDGNSTDLEGDISGASCEYYEDLPGISGRGRIIQVTSKYLTYQDVVTELHTHSLSEDDSFDRIIRQRALGPTERLEQHPDYLSESLIVINDKLMNLPDERVSERKNSNIIPEHRSILPSSFTNPESNLCFSESMIEHCDVSSTTNEKLNSEEHAHRDDTTYDDYVQSEADLPTQSHSTGSIGSQQSSSSVPVHPTQPIICGPTSTQFESYTSIQPVPSTSCADRNIVLDDQAFLLN